VSGHYQNQNLLFEVLHPKPKLLFGIIFIYSFIEYIRLLEQQKNEDKTKKLAVTFYTYFPFCIIYAYSFAATANRYLNNNFIIFLINSSNLAVYDKYHIKVVMLIHISLKTSGNIYVLIFVTGQKHRK